MYNLLTDEPETFLHSQLSEGPRSAKMTSQAKCFLPELTSATQTYGKQISHTYMHVFTHPHIAPVHTWAHSCIHKHAH
jgi:hypothetical protein